MRKRLIINSPTLNKCALLDRKMRLQAQAGTCKTCDSKLKPWRPGGSGELAPLYWKFMPCWAQK